MAVNRVYMDVPAVRDLAKRFHAISEVLTAVGKTLDVLSTVLKTTAFMGLVGGAAVARFIDGIRPDIVRMAEKCAELDHDLKLSVDAFERGDDQGATRFY
ncbi:MAG TPA: hypothetical protein VF952_04860 [Chloroflexia bacterium]|jgi:hypothetical protein